MIETGVFPRTAPRMIEALEGSGLSWPRYAAGTARGAFDMPPSPALREWIATPPFGYGYWMIEAT